MFSQTHNTTGQGAVGLAFAIAYYQSNGYNVLLPLVDNQSYDLVVEQLGQFLTVQVKTTKTKELGNYKVDLRRSRPNRTCNKKLPLGRCDLVFVLCEDGSQYSIPYSEIENQGTVTLGQRITPWKVVSIGA